MIARALLAALLALSLAPARAAEQRAAEVSVVPSMSGPGVQAAPLVTPQLNAPLTVPGISAPLNAPAAPGGAAAAGSPAQAAALSQPRAAAGGAAAPKASADAALGRAPGVDAARAAALPPPLPAAAVRDARDPRPDAARAPPAGEAVSSPSDAADHPLIQRAREEARKLGATPVESSAGDDRAVSRELGRLAGREGYALVPSGALVTPAIAANIAAEIDKKWDRRTDSMFNTWELQDEFKGWLRDVGGDAEGRGGARQVVEALTKHLQDALPGEAVTLRDSQLRLRYKKQDNDVLHVDGGYLTATITLKGPGTLLYLQTADGGLKEVMAPVGAVAVVTNVDRERATGIPGTVHSSPTSDRYKPSDDERWILIVRYKRAGQPGATPAESERLKASHDRARARAQRLRDAKNPPAKKPASRGWFGFGTRSE